MQVVLLPKRNSKVIVLKIFWILCLNLVKIYYSQFIFIYTNIWRSSNIFRYLNLCNFCIFINLNMTLKKRIIVLLHIYPTTIYSSSNLKNLLVYLNSCRASLVVQSLKICLAVQGIPIIFLVWENPTCHWAINLFATTTEPAHWSIYAATTEPRSAPTEAQCSWKPVLSIKRSRCKEKPTHCN